MYIHAVNITKQKTYIIKRLPQSIILKREMVIIRQRHTKVDRLIRFHGSHKSDSFFEINLHLCGRQHSMKCFWVTANVVDSQNDSGLRRLVVVVRRQPIERRHNSVPTSLQNRRNAVTNGKTLQPCLNVPTFSVSYSILYSYYLRIFSLFNARSIWIQSSIFKQRRNKSFLSDWIITLHKIVLVLLGN